MKWLLSLILRGYEAQIVSQREEIAWLRVQVETERRRAEAAIDQCRITHQAIGPVTPAPPPTAAEVAARERSDAMFNNPEVRAMGLPEGVD